MDSIKDAELPNNSSKIRCKVRCAYCYIYRPQAPDRKYFCFPANEAMCKKWVSLCNRPYLLSKSVTQLHKSFKICSEHFQKSDFKTSKMHRLKTTAYPSFDLNPSDCGKEKENILEVIKSNLSMKLNVPFGITVCGSSNSNQTNIIELSKEVPENQSTRIQMCLYKRCATTVSPKDSCNEFTYKQRSTSESIIGEEPEIFDYTFENVSILDSPRTNESSALKLLTDVNEANRCEEEVRYVESASYTETTESSSTEQVLRKKRRAVDPADKDIIDTQAKIFQCLKGIEGNIAAMKSNQELFLDELKQQNQLFFDKMKQQNHYSASILENTKTLIQIGAQLLGVDVDK